VTAELSVFVFAPFRLDTNNEQLWRGTEEIRLRRKTFAVLRHLVEHSGQLVTKAALLDTVWPDLAVSDSMPAISVREVRAALGDDVGAPRFIETIRGRGYRFIAEVTHEVVGGTTSIGGHATRTEARPRFNSFVGRKHEWSQLLAALADATSGQGRLCLISGEPGIGKTRLCAELAREAQAGGAVLIVGHCSEQEATPYLPFIEILEGYIDRASDPDAVRKLLGDEAADLARLLPKLNRLLPDLPIALNLPADLARRQLFNSFSNFIARQAREQPIVLIVEDLHWADESTLALMHHLSQRIPGLPVLVIGTHRDTEVDLGPALSRTLDDLIRGRLAIQIRLKGLPSGDVAQMLETLSGKTAPAMVVGEFMAETDGNPFFVEELFRHLAEVDRLYDSAGEFRARLNIGELNVPPNVRLVVGRRVARLDDLTRKILAVAAVIGRSFAFELLQAAVRMESAALLNCLDAAQALGLIRSSTEQPRAEFEFCHELIRQAILTPLSVARRHRLHLEVAEAIEETCSAMLEAHASELAYHYVRTDKTWKAVKYLDLAGKQAIQQSAHAEALDKLSAAIALLRNLPENPERDKKELSLLLSTGIAVIAVKGFSDPEVERTYLRAMELCQRRADTGHLSEAQQGLAVHYLLRSRIRQSQEMAKKVLDLVRRTNSQYPALPVAIFYFAMPTFWLGELEISRAHLEEAIALTDAVERPSQKPYDSLTGSLRYLAWNLWYLGYPEKARVVAQRALTEARERTDLFALAGALSQVARFHVLRREARIAEQLACEGLALGNEQGFPTWSAECMLVQGWAMVHTGLLAKGIVRLREGLAARWAIGEAGAQAHYTGWLAEALGKVGGYEEGLKLLDEVLEPEHEILVYEPELYWIKGGLLLAQDSSSASRVEDAFRSAIDISRKHHSRPMELRATTGLADLLAKNGRRDEARAMLAEIYNWFTEGFDTADLQNARTLLDLLNQ
jgi:DNA-binding winged helix-turn-helix (wHTH) protein/tetratricopeptide (TPR) repeat protein